MQTEIPWRWSNVFNFETPLNSSGDYKYFPPISFLTFEKNPFTADTRLTDLTLLCAALFMIGSFKIPENYIFEGCLKTSR